MALPDTGRFWTNCRGQKLHLRYAEPTQLDGVMVLIHSYGRHVNSPVFWQKSINFAEQLNVAIFSFDMTGHGYSEGEHGQIDDFDDLAQDVAHFCDLLCTATEASGDGYNLCSPELLQRLKHKKIVVAGESMGGAVALLASLRFGPASPYVGGLLLLAPSLMNISAPCFLGQGLNALLKRTPSARQLPIPAMFLPKITGSKVFSDEMDIESFNSDDNLGFQSSMNAATAAAFVRMFEDLPAKMPEVGLPLLILHDPEDKICPPQGSEMLMDLCASEDKCFVPVPGGRHAPHVNEYAFCLPLMYDFVQSCVCDPAPGLGALKTMTCLSRLSRSASKQIMGAAIRWPAKNRVAPYINLTLLLGHTAIVAAPPVLLLVDAVVGTWILAGLVASFALLGAYFQFEAACSLFRLLRAERARKAREVEEVPGVFACRLMHLVCVAIYKEPDSMLLDTLKQLNDSPSACRMRVVFAMEEATDRSEERFRLYQKNLSNVKDVVYYIHQPKQGEIRGLCSNLAHALSEDLSKLTAKDSSCDLDNYILTKVDSQAHLPLHYFTELEWSVQDRRRVKSEGPVVWQPVLGSFLNRSSSIGPVRALMSMRSFCYPALFKMNLLTVTCYSVPLRQYVNMGRHHPCYMGEDCMVAAQSSVDASRCATVAMLPVLVEVAPPLDSNCCGALRETARQCVRWAAQSTEAAEFRWRFRGPRSTLGTAWWLLKYWFVRVAMMNALGAFAISLSVAVQLDIALPELESWVLLVMDKFLLVVVLALFVVMPVYEQLLAQLARHEVPWRQLPATILSFPGAVLANTVVDLWAWHKLLSRGKAAITLTHRKKIVAKDPVATKARRAHSLKDVKEGCGAGDTGLPLPSGFSGISELVSF
ncbi:unnamed protein product [Effrenium voratum]|nr:unnamed protein product [Effrenium voratum]